MNLKLIKTEKNYQNALKHLEKIFDSQPGTKAGDELDLLVMLIERYENEKYPIGDPGPIEAIKFRMEQMDISQNDLVEILGSKNHVTEIMSRKKKLTLNMIRKLNKSLKIPAEVLVQLY